MDKKYKYTLFGTSGSWQSYAVHGNNLKELKAEATRRLKKGYTASILNNKSGIQTNYKIKNG
jgi:hypothetical protein